MRCFAHFFERNIICELNTPRFAAVQTLPYTVPSLRFVVAKLALGVPLPTLRKTSAGEGQPILAYLAISSTSFSRSSSDLAKSSKSHPELAKALAVALPIPLEAPVINTVDKNFKGEN